MKRTCVRVHLPSARSSTAKLWSLLIGPLQALRCYQYAASSARRKCTRRPRSECARAATESWCSWARSVDVTHYRSKTCGTPRLRRDFRSLLVQTPSRENRRACCTCRSLAWLCWLSISALIGLFLVLSAVSTAAARSLGWRHLFLQGESPSHLHQSPSSFWSR